MGENIYISSPNFTYVHFGSFPKPKLYLLDIGNFLLAQSLTVNLQSCFSALVYEC